MVPTRLRPSDSGFTMIELIATMAVLAIMFGIAATAFIGFQAKSQHTGARDEMVSSLRNAAERALSEQRVYCVEISASSWSLYRTACAGASAVEVQADVTLASAAEQLTGSFAAPAGHTSACAASACVYFYPRGNSSDGTLTVSRSGQPDYTIDVEGLTSRVSTS